MSFVIESDVDHKGGKESEFGAFGPYKAKVLAGDMALVGVQI